MVACRDADVLYKKHPLRNITISYISLADLADDAYLPFLPQLFEEERARAMRFVFAKDRLAFTLGRVLARRLLRSHCAPPPGGWRFATNPYGRPELPDSNLRFNISHCAGMVAAAVTVEHELGLDVERIDRNCTDIAIARSYFAPSERLALASAPEEERKAMFFAFWTLKEAYIKARGLGLSIPLADFSFTLNPPRISFSPAITDFAGRWYFWRGNPKPSHQMALAASRAAGETLGVSCQEVSPGSLLAASPELG